MLVYAMSTDPSSGAPSPCPLCGETARLRDAGSVHGRSYRECDECGLLYLDPELRPDPERERARYAEHRNDPTDPGYRRFLNRLCAPLARRLAPGVEGLDFGCGPGPALVAMLRARGFRAEGYDPFFAPRDELLERTWDFITCTEVIEHLHAPGREFERLAGLLRPGARLAVMTDLLAPGTELSTWYYLRDPTHVCFYRDETFEWLARRHGWRLERPDARVAIFQPPRREPLRPRSPIAPRSPTQ